MTAVLKKRREERKAAELARLLASLDTMACAERAWRPRRSLRLSLGSTR